MEHYKVEKSDKLQKRFFKHLKNTKIGKMENDFTITTIARFMAKEAKDYFIEKVENG